MCGYITYIFLVGICARHRKAQNYMDIHFEELLRKEISTTQSRRRTLSGFRPSMGFSLIKKTSVLPYFTTVLNFLTINSLFSKSWRRERLPTPVFWPRESHGLNNPSGRRVGHDWATFTSLYFLSLIPQVSFQKIKNSLHPKIILSLLSQVDFKWVESYECILYLSSFTLYLWDSSLCIAVVCLVSLLYTVLWVYHNLLIHATVDEYIAIFQHHIMTNSAAMNCI